MADPDARRSSASAASGARAGSASGWSSRTGREAKIAAIGVRIRRWVSYHGVALNLDPELEHFAGIVPCGIREFGVTSLADLGLAISMAELDGVLRTPSRRFSSAGPLRASAAGESRGRPPR